MQLFTLSKEIRRDDWSGDYDCFLQGEYVGTRKTRVAAEELLDDEAYKLLMLEPALAGAEVAHV